MSGSLRMYLSNPGPVFAGSVLTAELAELAEKIFGKNFGGLGGFGGFHGPESACTCHY